MIINHSKREFRVLSLLLLILLNTNLWAKSWCSPTELNLKNCSIQTRELEVHVNEADVRVNNNVWHHLRHLKQLETTQQWDSLGLRTFSERIFLQAKVWKKSKVLESIEHLNWLVWEVDGTELKLKIQEVIQKRKKIKEGEFITDPLEKHGIKFKNKKLIWWFKTEQKPL